eukprot:m.33775 g.33775  ORF g.33775 m.33775 type:complete len:196 (-) comp8594_c0_seq4:799-1386(-)
MQVMRVSPVNLKTKFSFILVRSRPWEYMVEECNGFLDTACTRRCGYNDAVDIWSGRVFTDVSSGLCEPVTRCLTEQYETAPETWSSNRVCENKTKCEDIGAFQVLDGTATSDRLCKPLREPCEDLLEFESQEPTPTTDRICTTVVACAQDEYVTLSDATSGERQCVPKTICGDDEYILNNGTRISDRECAKIPGK